MLAIPMDSETTMLPGVGWQTYLRLRADLDAAGVRSKRVFFGEEGVFLVSPSHRHDVFTKLIGTLVQEWAVSLGIRLGSALSTTLRRDDLQRAAEADDCFWIDNDRYDQRAPELELPAMPAPDLIVEVDVSRSSDPRMPIYAALGVREIWRVRVEQRGPGFRLSMHVLREGVRYEEVEESEVLTGVRRDWAQAQVERGYELGITDWLRKLRAELAFS